MKELKDMTTAELVAEWKRLYPRSQRLIVTPERSPEYCKLADKVNSMLSNVTAELDARCEKWRMGLNAEGGLVMGNGDKIHVGRQMNGAAVLYDLSEFRALLGYLEQRGKDGAGLRILEQLADENLQRVMGDDTKGGGK